VKYDDASWHYEGDFPKELDPQAGATHAGMFLAWCVLHGMAGELHTDDLADELAKLRARELTPGQWFVTACDAKFVDDDLNDEGNAFAAAYYALDRGLYLGDYDQVLGQTLPSLYHVPDTWDTYDRLAPVIAQRYGEWKRQLG
jgi:hypothetical protein